MKKILLASILFILGESSFSGEVELPQERLAIPIVEGNHLVCIWDEAAGNWVGSFEDYNHAGIYDFQIPEWGNWYWIGLWDQTAGEYVVGKWVGHFLTY